MSLLYFLRHFPCSKIKWRKGSAIWQLAGINIIEKSIFFTCLITIFSYVVNENKCLNYNICLHCPKEQYLLNGRAERQFFHMIYDICSYLKYHSQQLLCFPILSSGGHPCWVIQNLFLFHFLLSFAGGLGKYTSFFLFLGFQEC